MSTLYPKDVAPEMLAEYKSQLSTHNSEKAFKPDADAILAAGGHKADPVLVAMLNSNKDRIRALF